MTVPVGWRILALFTVVVLCLAYPCANELTIARWHSAPHFTLSSHPQITR